MNMAEIDSLRRAHQKIEKAIIEMSGDLEYQAPTGVLEYLEEAERLLWGQLEDPACVELLKQVPMEVLEKLSGFRPELLQATARRLTLKGF